MSSTGLLRILTVILAGMIGYRCALPTSRPFPPEPKLTDPDSRITAGIEQYTTMEQWKQSGYFRLVEDASIALPVQVAFSSGDNLACILTNSQWANWRERQVVRCSTAWRIRRSF